MFLDTPSSFASIAFDSPAEIRWRSTAACAAGRTDMRLNG
ncbi:hypothetical protein ACPOL_7051 (plasmid) [Acidisarcina polymorpha]|uniref:Uncharacterized protein n=1 Tax=Acidisarcina polymorpha TaxID=2211140 RepID=A0A2Z5GAW5_9BACT|nr:hypothetical protein ACPOL_7051 [Acidisarcina polymorpha]